MMDFNQIYLVSYQGRYLEIDAETTDDARELAFMRFNAKNISDIDVYLTVPDDSNLNPYYF